MSTAPTCAFAKDTSRAIALARQNPTHTLSAAALGPGAVDGCPTPTTEPTLLDAVVLFAHAMHSGLVTVPLAVHGVYITPFDLTPDSADPGDPNLPLRDTLLWVVRPDGARTSVPCASLRPARHYPTLGVTPETVTPVSYQHALLAAMVDAVDKATATMWVADPTGQPDDPFAAVITRLTDAQWDALCALPVTSAASARFEDAFDAARFVRDSFGRHVAAPAINAAMHALYATGRGQWTGGRWVLYTAAALAVRDRVGDPTEPAWTTTAFEALTSAWLVSVGPLPV